MLEIAKSKINSLLKILKNFVDRNRLSINIKNQTANVKQEKAQLFDESMLVDEDNLEYTRKIKNFESVEKSKKEQTKKKGIPLYEIK